MNIYDMDDFGDDEGIEQAPEVYLHKLIEFESWVRDQEVPEDFSDWNMYDWQMYALDYLKSSWDHAVEEAHHE